MFTGRVESLLNLFDNHDSIDYYRGDTLQTRANTLYHHAVRLCSLGIVAESTVENLKLTVDLLFRATTDYSSLCFQSDIEHSEGEGCPKFRITPEQRFHMFENGLKAVQIATLLGVSERTVRRRAAEFGIESSGSFSDIDDATLDATIRNLLVQYPNSG